MPNVFVWRGLPIYRFQAGGNSRGLAKNLSNPHKPKQPSQKSGTTKDRQALGPQVTSRSTKQIDQKTIGPFAPTRFLQTKTQQLLRKVERNHFRPRDFTCCVGISNPFPLCSRSVTRSCYKKFRFNSSPCRCRSQQTPVNRGNKGNTLFKRKLLQQIIPGPEKRRNLPPCNQPQPAQQIY